MKAAPTDRPALTAFMRLEDAQRVAKECAAVLASHFELLATQFNDDDIVKMFAAMGYETLARDIIKHLDVMNAAARELLDGADRGSR